MSDIPIPRPTRPDPGMPEKKGIDPPPFRDKLKSLHFARKEARKPKETVDHHDYGKVTVTEHYDERVDVNVQPEPARVKAQVKETE